ncbi:hypothetical protein F5148DRAFT_1274448 [Russula earlei]|uniref:Uncharacterized protein n=1 Tax=Russula earlei TaxID=71964 RepID=A0ACC0UHK1_9AGAM|nr:hypothetical protein F5148DRAFT_1274448 [Russula earlei]
MTAAFFYGTLMHPKILKRVLHNDGSHLKICAAILTGYTRHKIKMADYPAILPYERSKTTLLGRELTAEERSVRGTLVAGLTARDVMYLDVFEGDEYVRSQVTVHPLGPYTPIPTDAAATSEVVEDSLIPIALPPLPSAGELAQTVPAQTYVWCLENTCLEEELWSFDEFVRKNAWKWIDEGAEDNEDIRVVDKCGRARMKAGVTHSGDDGGRHGRPR